ncbi:MAG: hypothetical protein R2939_19225 [Kofleriaceae bacterium]
MTAPRLRVQGTAPGVVSLSGVIDEAAGLDAVLPLAVDARLRLDLGGVTFVNSVGVRDWIHLLAAAAAAGVAIELVRVSEPMVQQLNMIVATRGHAAVRSFVAPYACDACGHEEARLLELAEHGDTLRAGAPPPAPCPACPSPMAFDDFPERYLAFLTDERRVPAAVTLAPAVTSVAQEPG